MQVVSLSNVAKVPSVAMLESAFSHVLYKGKAHTLANVMMVILESFVRQVIINLKNYFYWGAKPIMIFNGDQSPLLGRRHV